MHSCWFRLFEICYICADICDKFICGFYSSEYIIHPSDDKMLEIGILIINQKNFLISICVGIRVFLYALEAMK